MKPVKMIDIGGKNITERIAIAKGRIIMKANTIKLIKNGKIEKGDVLAVSKVAGVMASKNTPFFIPLCHPIQVESVNIDFKIERNAIEVIAKVKTHSKTGVEMEALVSCSASLLTIYDMCKKTDKGMIISDIKLMFKSGGASGTFQRQ